MQKATVLYRH